MLSNNAKNYRQSPALRSTPPPPWASRLEFIKPHCPWINGKAEHLNRTLATECAHTRPYDNNDELSTALPAWLGHYNL